MSALTFVLVLTIGRNFQIQTPPLPDFETCKMHGLMWLNENPRKITKAECVAYRDGKPLTRDAVAPVP